MDDSKRGVIVNRMGVFVAIPIAFVNDKRITNTGRCLYMLLVSYTSMKADEPIAFPSYETIMGRLDWGSKDTVAAALLNLMQHGWVERKRRYGNSSVYTINYAAGPSRPEIGLSPAVRKADYQKSGKQTTDSPESGHQLEVLGKPEVPDPDEEARARDEAARKAGIANSRSIRSKKAKAAAKKREADKYDLEGYADNASVKTYLAIFEGVQLPRELAGLIAAGTVMDTDGAWAETCKEWAKGNPTTGKTWNPLSIDKMLTLYRAKRAQARANGPNGGAPAVSKADAALALLRERGHVA